jgi:restriction endonuclease S subunit
MHLKDIAEVIPGYAFRGSIEVSDSGDTRVLQARNIVLDENFVDADSLVAIAGGPPRGSTYLQKGDVLLVARGMGAGSFKSSVYEADAINVIASSSVYILRVVSVSLLPDFLSSYLNSPSGQQALAGILTGSYIGALPKSELLKVKIPIPSLAKQKAMVDLHENILKQQSILDRKHKLKQKIISTFFRNLTTA